MGMMDRIKKVFQKPTGLAEGTRLVINCEKLEHRVALLEDGVLEEYSIERPAERNIVGAIFKGRVKNIEQGLKAMFVDIGMDKNAFLHFWDAIPAALDGGLEEIERDMASGGEGGGGKARGRNKPRITSKDIPDIYPVGAEVLVQVTKGPIGTKGPRVTTNISLAGRLLVLMPLNAQFGISRKIDEPQERARLRKVLQQMEVPEGMGVIFRTCAAGQKRRFLVRDLHFLLEEWRQIAEIRDTEQAPVQCFEEPDLVERTVRDFLTDEIDEVVCDDPAMVERMTAMAAQISRRARKRIKPYQGTKPIFDTYRITKQIEDAFFRQVWLPCGGYIVIDQTEALISIDVNTGRNKGGKNMDKTILDTNLEAAAEVARQLRLRNLGGLIVVDFIDMRSRKDQQAVYRMMKDRLKRDKAKTQVLPLSALGLMEMTRQRLQESLSDSMYDPCPHCQGRGIIKSTLTMSVELQRAIAAAMSQAGETNRDLVITVNPQVMERLRTEDEQHLAELQRRHAGRLTFRGDPTMHREAYTISDGQSGEMMRS